MMNKTRIYDGALIDVDGITFKISIRPDEDQDAPWENSDVCGPIAERRRWYGEDHPTKRPGEVFLGSRGMWNCFYDFRAAVLEARRDGWNTAPYTWKTPGEQADASARAMVRYLRGYLSGSWQYVTIEVTPLDDSGDVIPFLSESMSGIEYGDDPEMHSYAAEEAESLARYLINSHNGMFSKLPMVSDVIEADEELPDLDPDGILDPEYYRDFSYAHAA